MKKRFGLIGHPLGHTLSPFIHKIFMKSQNLAGEYKVYDIKPEEFDNKIKKILSKLDGFNITIPYKNKIVPYLNDISSEAKEYGAVNTVKDGYGYNTDVYGFRMCNIPLENRRVLILGAGGAARMMLHESINSGAREITICARDISKAQILIKEFQDSRINDVNAKDNYLEGVKDNNLEIYESFYDNKRIKKTGIDKIYTVDLNDLKASHDVILNATPVGMWPHCNEMPVPKEILLGCEYVFDSIYNPLATKLILTARSYGIKSQNGLAMLYYQALKAQKTWNPDLEFSNLNHYKNFYRIKRKMNMLFHYKFLLTGFMGSGKSTVGKSFAGMIGATFVDLDDFITLKSEMSIPDIFEKRGETVFRDIESDCLMELLTSPQTMVIATGGGALIQKVNAENTKKHNGFIFFLNVDINTILNRVSGGEGRPLLKDNATSNARKLYDERFDTYFAIADAVIDGEGEISEVAKRIVDILDF